ncbi:MAG: AzlD domain-containing protein [Betaproteobacteria bacterium]
MSEWQDYITILGLACVTVLTRTFFFISDQSWPMPSWLDRALQYAPIAAIAAVIGPEILMTQGQLITPWQDARLYAAIAGAMYYFARGGQGQAVLGTIVAGMSVYIPLHVALKW